MLLLKSKAIPGQLCVPKSSTAFSKSARISILAALIPTLKASSTILADNPNDFLIRACLLKTILTRFLNVLPVCPSIGTATSKEMFSVSAGALAASSTFPFIKLSSSTATPSEFLIFPARSIV